MPSVFSKVNFPADGLIQVIYGLNQKTIIGHRGRRCGSVMNTSILISHLLLTFVACMRAFESQGA